MSGIYSVIPSLAAIIIAIFTRQVLPALLVGLTAGSYLVEPSLLGGIIKTADYLVKSATVRDNIEIAFFLYIFSGLMGMMKVAGGVKGVEKLISDRVKSERGTLLTTWGLSLFTFIDCGFHVMSVGTIMDPIAEKLKVAKEKLSYVVDTATVPLIVLAPLGTTYIGYMVAMVRTGLKESGIKGDAYSLFLKTIPLNFYSLVAIAISLVVIITGKYINWKKESAKKDKKEPPEHHHGSFKEDVKPRALNLILPLILLFALTIYFLWWSGSKKANSLLTALMKANTSEMMLVALLLTVIITSVYYLLQKISLEEIISGFSDGGNEIIVAIVLLFLVWGIASVSNDLGFSKFITGTLGDFLPAFLVPVVLFLFGSLVSYFIGTSWGTWGLLMPLGVSLAAATGASLPLSIGAVFAGGTFGDHISPLSETTVVTATVLKMPVMVHANSQLIYGIIGVIISAVLYLIAGLF